MKGGNYFDTRMNSWFPGGVFHLFQLSSAGEQLLNTGENVSRHSEAPLEVILKITRCYWQTNSDQFAFLQEKSFAPCLLFVPFSFALAGSHLSVKIQEVAPVR